jgi:hypothetical protein
VSLPRGGVGWQGVGLITPRILDKKFSIEEIR